jgi:hypothetical protein
MSTDDLAPMGEDTATPTEPQGGEQEAPKTDEYQARVDQRLEELTRAQQAMLEQFQATQQPVEDDDEFDLEEGDDGFEQQELERWLQQQVEAGVEKRLAPLQQEQQLDRRNIAYEKLTEQFDDLQDPEKARPYVEAAFELVEGNDAFVNSPRFVDLIEKVYKAAKADERAALETPADGRTTPLETQAGAAPAANDGESLDDRLSKIAQKTNTF